MNKYFRVAGISFLGVSSLLFSACVSRNHREQQKASVSIPGYIVEPKEQLEYVVRHYWDSIDLSDSLWLEQPEAFEAKFVDYFSLLSDLPKISHRLLLTPLERLDGAMLLEALSYYRRYYYEPDSPLADDELYRYVVVWAIQSPKVPKAHQDVARELLKGLQRNRVGHKATDFVYANDSTSLRLLPLRQELLLLIFGTSKCHACEAIHNYVRQNPVYSRLALGGKLRVLTVYVQSSGEEKNIFATDSLRPEWHSLGLDVRDSIINNRLYDIKGSPTIYLLGKGGKVLLRDPKPSKLTEYLTHYEEK